MSEDFDKREWQAEQELVEKARLDRIEKTKKSKARAARKAQRMLEKLSDELKETGDLTDWEEEFTESVGERLEQYGSAFHDPEKGSPADALSFAQKKVMASLGKKVRDNKQKHKPKTLKPKNGFGRKQAFTPRVRHIEDDIIDDEPETMPPKHQPSNAVKRPFLRLVKNKDDI